MSKKSIATLKGYIQLVSDCDGIGVAVYGEQGSNYELIAESDGDLTITRFVEIYPEQGYSLVEFPPDLQIKKKHSIGEPSIIPFVCDQKAHVIYGDRYPMELEALIAETPQGILIKQTVQTLLARAREGYFRRLLDKWSDADFQAAFPEVFEERPSNSRYWVSRYRLSVAQNQKRAAPSAYIAEELRRTGVRWLTLFGAKTDFNRLKSLFGEVNDGIFSRDDLAASVYGFFANRYANRDFKFLEKMANEEPLFLALFPEGLYYFDLRNTGLKTPFLYLRPSDYLLEVKSRLYSAINNIELAKTKGLALVLFGTRDVPIELIEVVQKARYQFYGVLNDCTRKLNYVTRSPHFPECKLDEEEIRVSKRLISSFEALIELEAIEYGGARLSPRMNDFLADDKPFVEQVKTCLKINSNA